MRPSVNLPPKHDRDLSKASKFIVIGANHQKNPGTCEVAPPLLFGEAPAVQVELVRLVDQLQGPWIIPLTELHYHTSLGSFQEIIGYATRRVRRFAPGRGIPDVAQP